jgi:hypothetical protein
MSDLAERALDRQAARLQATIVRRQATIAEAQATAFYRGNGQYSTLGAAGSYRPRGTVSSGGVPIGQSVPANGGLVGGMPAGTNGTPTPRAPTNERLATVAQERGPQLGSGNPNDTAATPRYPQDHYYDTTTGNLWQWQPAEGETPGTWIPVAGSTEALPFRIEADVVEATTYTLDPYQHYPVRVEAVEGVTGATVTTTPAIGEVAAVGDAISITLSALPEPAVVVLGSILLRRV